MSENKKKPVHYVLWVFQVLLALLFIFAGGMKLVTPYEEMAKQMANGPVVFSEPFLKFIGLAELLGGLGLILPSALRIKPGLTPLAAAGLVIIMIGATVISLKMGFSVALMPLVTGILAAFVAYGRWKLAPIPDRSQTAASGIHSVSRSQA
jgi:putative oxidoreductase